MSLGEKFLYICLFLVIATDAKSITPVDEKEPFTLQEFFTSAFATKGFNGTWISGDTFIHKNTDGDVLKYNVVNQESTPLFSKSVLDPYPGATIFLSNDQRYVLIRHNVSAVFRHSTTALFAIYDIENQKYYDLAGKEHIQLAEWSNDDHGLVYVYQNNIYYLKNPEDVDSPVPITNDVNPEGKSVFYNGVPDWVYEEEVLGSGSAIWFSPDGKKLAFASFNDSEVPEFDYFVYGTPGSLEDQYPKLRSIRYPKVGQNNPIVRTYVVNLDAPETLIEIAGIHAPFLKDDNYVLYGMTWPTNEEVSVMSTNRVQNQGALVRCFLNDGSCKVEATYESPGGWLDARIPKYNKDGSRRLEILPQAEGEKDAYDHILLTDIESNTTRQLTAGRFVVTTIYGWDEANNNIYFGGSSEDLPSRQHVYVINPYRNQGFCLTCAVETPSGTCLYGTASFSKDLSHYARICNGPGPYQVDIVNSKDLQDAMTVAWEHNLPVREKLSRKLLPVTKNLTVPVADGFTANVRLLLPPDLDESKKYPAIVNVYGGPDSNQIKDSYSAGFQNYLVTNRNYIYIYIDGRGSGRDGQNKKFQIYRKLATVEIEDQISVTKYLQETFPFIDANNTGIWGWSYGGFASVWALAKDHDNVFKFALSVAPVTSFIYYDSIYTERYMGLPTEEDNLEGYNNTDVTRRVDAIRGKLYFLIHGNADDNVHYQQAMLLSRALELADIPFRQQSYPDENHSLSGVSPHLYHTIDGFFARSFNVTALPKFVLYKKENDV